jgi:hypothetical protein
LLPFPSSLENRPYFCQEEWTLLWCEKSSVVCFPCFPELPVTTCINTFCTQTHSFIYNKASLPTQNREVEMASSCIYLRCCTCAW